MPLHRARLPLALALALANPFPARSAIILIPKPFTFKGADGPVRWIHTRHHTAAQLRDMAAQLKAAPARQLRSYGGLLESAVEREDVAARAFVPSEADLKAATEADPLVGLRVDGSALHLHDLGPGQDFAGARFYPGQIFTGLDLGGCDFTGADLADVDLRGCVLGACDFSSAHLAGTRFPDEALKDPTIVFEGPIRPDGYLDLTLRPDGAASERKERIVALAGSLRLGVEVGRQTWHDRMVETLLTSAPIQEIPLDGLDLGRVARIGSSPKALTLLMADRRSLVQVSEHTYWIYSLPEAAGTTDFHEDGLWVTLPESRRILFVCGAKALANRADDPVATVPDGIHPDLGMSVSKLEVLTATSKGDGIDLTRPDEKGGFATRRVFEAQEGERVVAFGETPHNDHLLGLAATTRGLLALGPGEARRLPIENCPFQAGGPTPGLSQDKAGRYVVLHGGRLHHLHPGRKVGKRMKGGELVPLAAKVLEGKTVSGLATLLDGQIAFATSRPSGVGLLDGTEARWWPLDEGSRPVQVIPGSKGVLVLRLAGRNSLLVVVPALLGREAEEREKARIEEARARKKAEARAATREAPKQAKDVPPGPAPVKPEEREEKKEAKLEATALPPYKSIGLDHILQGHAHGSDPTRGWFPEGATRAWVSEKAAETLAAPTLVLDSFNRRKLAWRTFPEPVGDVVDTFTGKRIPTRHALCVHEPDSGHVVTFYPVWSLPRYAGEGFRGKEAQAARQGVETPAS